MKDLRVLHISNDFPNSSLYRQLVLHLDEFDIKQTVYSAVRTPKEVKFSLIELNHLDVNIKNILNFSDRFLYRNKINKVFRNLCRSLDPHKIDLVHAHTLYSDGGVALKVKKKFNIPYIVAIRSTDLNAFQKYRPDLRWRRDKILREAEKVIFISIAHREKFLNLLRDPLNHIVEGKAVTVPNGLDPLFLEYQDIGRKVDPACLRLLYVGAFKKLKNIPVLIEAIDIISKKKEVKLTLVGGGGKDDKKVRRLINSNNYPFLEYTGIITDRRTLRNVYACNDIFVMVSKPETFGLVYVEALSQGLPIIYTKGEGIDGYFEEQTVGEKVDNIQNPYEIAQKIGDISHRLNTQLKKQCVAQAQRFDWSKLVAIYYNIYRSIIAG